MGKIRLKGMTWNHSRGYVPLVATAQRFSELHPEVEISWEKRSLQAFADQPIEDLAAQYDLIIIDHPHCGLAAARPVLKPLEELLPADFLADQLENQVGRSHESYAYGGHQWALAVDAAAPVASWRADLLEKAGAAVPQSWEDLQGLSLQNLVILPAIPIDLLMEWYALCNDLDDSLFFEAKGLVDREAGIEALERLKELVSRCPADCLERNPIRVYEALVSDEHPAAYCPFAYGYSNYARNGYAAARLTFGDVPTGPSGKSHRTTLGGTGIAISANCRHLDVAAAYAMMVSGPACQATLYLETGGQPGHRSAWLDEPANALCHGFFKNTLATLDRSYVRPRYDGYMHFQDNACLEVHACVRGEKSPRSAVAAMERIYAESLSANPLIESLS